MRFDQATQLRNVRFGDALVNTPSGIDSELQIDVDAGPKLRFVFDGRRWFFIE